MTALIWKLKVPPQCQADPQASPCLWSLDPLTSVFLERVYKTYITTKWDSVRVCEGVSYHIHILCTAWISSLQRHVTTGIMMLKEPQRRLSTRQAPLPGQQSSGHYVVQQPCRVLVSTDEKIHPAWWDIPLRMLAVFTLNTGSCAPSTHCASLKEASTSSCGLQPSLQVQVLQLRPTVSSSHKTMRVLYQAQNHAVHCRDWEPQLGTMLAITAESRGITREGTISITQAELDQKKLSSPKFNRVLWFFFFFWCLNFFYGSWGWLPAQWVAHSSL